MSDGLFDITSGILRKAWTFDGTEQIPAQTVIDDILSLVGGNKVHWKRPVIQIPEGMEIDLGGVGKEYAVDKTLQLLRQMENIGLLVNFGGDIAVGGKRSNDLPWTIGIESISRSQHASQLIQVKNGALATSGDTKKFLLMKGKRHGHILNPKTGGPVLDPPHSVTVAAATPCWPAPVSAIIRFLPMRLASSP